MAQALVLNPKIFEDKTVALAVSGGRDSMALLHLFMCSNLNFFVVNIEHGIRGEASKDDSKFVERYCHTHNILFETYTVDTLTYANENRMTIEQSARILRYEVFDSLIAGNKCDFVATAHHLDDQAETILMRILRGTGLSGLRGIEQVRGGFVRPLLDFTRESIENYIVENQIPFVEDSTNSETDANRNFLRLEVLPLIETRYPAYRETLSRLSKNASEAQNFIASKMQPFERVYKNAIRIKMPFSESIVFKYEIMQAANALGIFCDIEECHLDALVALQTAQNAKQLSLAHGLVAIKEPNGILLAIDNDFDATTIIPFSSLEFPTKIVGEIFAYNICSYNGEKLTHGELMFDRNKIPKSAIIRYRNDGDKFTKFGGGTKSLGDFFTDKKIPLWERNRVLVCADGNDVLFIAGIEISDKIKVDKTTTNILVLTKEKLWNTEATSQKY